MALGVYEWADGRKYDGGWKLNLREKRLLERIFRRKGRR